MNEEILLDALNEISDEHIAEAVLYEKKRKIRWGRVLPLAACLVLVAVSALTAIRHTDTPTATDASVIDTTAATTAAFAPTTAAPAITAAPAAPESTTENTTSAGVPDITAAPAITGATTAATTSGNESHTTVGCHTTVAWENTPYSYCYRQFSFEGINYINHSGALTGEDNLGKMLGSTVLTSSDDEGKQHSVNADVYEIKGVSKKCAVALYFKDGVQQNNCAQGYYVYYNSSYVPETLGQAMDEMNFGEKMLFGRYDIYIYYDAETDDGKVISRNYIINENAVKAFKGLLENSKNLKGEAFEYDAMIRSQNLAIGASYLGAWTEFRLNGDGYLYFGLGDSKLQYNIGKDAFEELVNVLDSECQVENSTAPALNITTTSQTTAN